MALTSRTKLLGALTPFMLAVSPALAHATATPSSSRTEQTITRFYDQPTGSRSVRGSTGSRPSARR